MNITSEQFPCVPCESCDGKAEAGFDCKLLDDGSMGFEYFHRIWLCECGWKRKMTHEENLAFKQVCERQRDGIGTN